MFQKSQHLLKGLINSFVCKFWLVKKIIVYPYSILPKPRFFSKINFDDLIKVDDYLIGRRSGKSVEDTFDEFGYVRTDAIVEQRGQMANLSMNLLGGKFCAGHIKYNPKAKGANEWNGKDYIPFLSKRLLDYDTFKIWAPIYLSIRKFHNQDIPFTTRNDKMGEKFIKAFKGTPISDPPNLKLFGKMKIVHKPTNLNYWHIELHLFDPDEKHLTKISNAWEKSPVNYLLEHLFSKTEKQEFPFIPIVPKKFYRA